MKQGNQDIAAHRDLNAAAATASLTGSVWQWLAWGAVVLLILVSWFWPTSGLDINILAKNLPPSVSHPFGTDWLGRDMLTRTLKSLLTSIWVGGLAVALSGLLAMGLAMLAMFSRISRILVDTVVDVFMSIPHLLLLILLSLAFGGGEAGLIVAVALSHWPRLTRLMRFEMLSVTRMPFYQLARQFGQGRFAVMRRHMLPHILPQWLVGTLLLFPHALVHMAALTFLGFGMDPLAPTIGGILSQSSNYLLSGQWWLGVFPGACLLILLLLFAYIADRANRYVRLGAHI
ncbi:peptide ABC transporter permease [Shewanella sp. NFH-SH190041]|uniref:ABC transporter permease n=1 Tax=Shewanella sp. NFH-SH190041 TaxID=2950245 RepID=UPI0021C477A1|nr:ABC transporter permease [Shewanella sp. NFH-SH190041]BDM64093.1 peptide ABC transporter permease [Shewanella sp. NFH-SH190041]